MTVTITSFGYRHSPELPQATITLDVRERLRDPHVAPAMRELTGLDQVVAEHVAATPGAARLVRHTALMVADLVAETAGDCVGLAIGCVGGRHRSVALAELIRDELAFLGVRADVNHRDLRKPVISTTRR
jgi:UPF0042 nucleotide-binding protein